MHLGVALGNLGFAMGRPIDPSAHAALVYRVGDVAERLRFHSVWVGDHLALPHSPTTPYPYGATPRTLDADASMLDPFAVLAALAGRTQRIKLGFGVLVLPYRHPLVVAKLIVLESGVGWLPWWLDKMDHWNEARLAGPAIELEPSEYVARQIWVSGDPDESSFAAVSQVAPPGRLIWASDFPHLDILDSEPSVTEELYEQLDAMPTDVAAGILGYNACEVYGLEVETS